jgi:hypothetical protein
MKILKHLQKMGLVVLLSAAANVQALPIGMTDITIFDGDNNGNTGWYGIQEDQEVEPGMDKHQKWDLEGFYQYGNQIAMIGGFDFKNGVSGYRGVDGQKDFRSGDIFIDINNSRIAGNASANDGNGQQVVKNTFGYEFVLDIDWAALTYDIIALGADSYTNTAYYDANYGSSPWKYVRGGEKIGQGSFSYESGLTDAQAYGNLGGGTSHYGTYGFDLSFLGNTDYAVHFTEGCGNDNLMGQGHVQVTEPGSIALLVLGAVGLVVMRRRINKQ